MTVHAIAFAITMTRNPIAKIPLELRHSCTLLAHPLYQSRKLGSTHAAVAPSVSRGLELVAADTITRNVMMNAVISPSLE